MLEMSFRRTGAPEPVRPRLPLAGRPTPATLVPGLTGGLNGGLELVRQLSLRRLERLPGRVNRLFRLPEVEVSGGKREESQAAKLVPPPGKPARPLAPLRGGSDQRRGPVAG